MNDHFCTGAEYKLLAVHQKMHTSKKMVYYKEMDSTVVMVTIITSTVLVQFRTRLTKCLIPPRSGNWCRTSLEEKSLYAIQLRTHQPRYLRTPERIDSTMILRHSRWSQNLEAVAESTRKVGRPSLIMDARKWNECGNCWGSHSRREDGQYNYKETFAFPNSIVTTEWKFTYHAEL